jgi:hypothetical protein
MSLCAGVQNGRRPFREKPSKNNGLTADCHCHLSEVAAKSKNEYDSGPNGEAKK